MTDIELFKESGKLKSFGNKTFNENLELTKKAIADIKPMQKVFDRQHSFFQTQMFIIGKHVTRGRSIRQICSEIHHKEEALLETLNRLSMKEIDIEEWKSQLKTEKNEFERKRLELKINHESIVKERTMEPIQATMRDILYLKSKYDEIYKNMTEAEIEEEEVSYWIMRIASQAYRAILLHGRINEGNSLAFMEIGINPHLMQEKILNFLRKEKFKPDLSEWNQQLKSYVEEFKDVPAQHMKIKNMKLGLFRDGIYEGDFEDI
jgi:hypothetical protein